MKYYIGYPCSFALLIQYFPFIYLVISDMSSGDEDCEESDEVSDFEDTIKRPTKKKTSERSTRKAKTTSSFEGSKVGDN